MSQDFHEDLKRPDDVKTASDRSFGVVFAIFFSIIGALPLIDGARPHAWAFAISAAFFLVAWARPSLLSPLNQVWMRFGLLLHKIVNPLILGFIFFIGVTPVALLMRALRKVPINVHFDPVAESYWIDRRDNGPAPDTMRRQF